MQRMRDVDGADELRVRRRRRPGKAQRPRRAAKALHRSGSGGPITRTSPTRASSISSAAAWPVSSDTCSFHSSDGCGASNSSAYPSRRVVSCVTCCATRGMETPPRAASIFSPQLAEAAHCHQPVRPLLAGEQPLAAAHVLHHLRVRKLRAAADQRAAHGRGPQLSRGVKPEFEEDGGAVLVREQAAGALAEHGRIQRFLAVGPVDGEPAPPRLRLQRAAAIDEEADVRDRVEEPEAAVRLRADVQCLVQVAAPRRVDGHQRQVAPVLAPAVRRGDALRRLLRLRQHLRGKAAANAQLRACGVERAPHHVLTVRPISRCHARAECR